MAPEITGNATPECGEQAIAPVNDTHVLLTIHSLDDVLGDSIGLHQHGIVELAVEQVCINEAWTDIGEADVQAFHL